MFISLPLLNNFVEPSTYSTILTYWSMWPTHWPNGKVANTLQQITTWPRSLMLGTGINRVFVGIRALLITVCRILIISNPIGFAFVSRGQPLWVPLRCHYVVVATLRPLLT